jgi:hypothetical protein
MARRSGELLVIGALMLAAPSAGAQPAPPAPPAPPATAQQAPPPVEEPPYDPAQHRGITEGAWLRATRGTARRSTGMMATGISFIGLAATLMAAGSAVYVNDNGCTSPNGLPMACGPGRVTGMALLSSGLIALGLGIPLTIHGAAEVPRAEAGSVSLRLTVRPELRGGGLTLQF